MIFYKVKSLHYDWVGFYFKNGEKEELKLAEFTGEPTEHTIIPFGKGICGQVAVSNESFIVQDVTVQENYISCGWKVKSEIVIPIFVNGENIGQIDVDSNSLNSFSERDVKLLESVCELISVKMKKSKLISKVNRYLMLSIEFEQVEEELFEDRAVKVMLRYIRLEELKNIFVHLDIL